MLSREEIAAFIPLLQDTLLTVATMHDLADLRSRLEEAESKILVLEERHAEIQKKLGNPSPSS